MPHGRFDTPPETMKITDNGGSVEGCGPIEWDGDGRPAQKVTITHVDIKQQSTGAHAKSGGDRPFERPPGKDDWMVPEIPCQGPKTFQDGPAEAFAEADVQLQSGDVIQERWPKEGRVQVLLSH